MNRVFVEETYYPLENVESSFEVKGSTFISYVIPINVFEKWVEQMRQRHPKAVHFVTASRFFNAQGQMTESFSDDGEPKGTAGMPTLKVLRGYGLIECGILSVRYFGGTLLGTGGLVRAYTQGAKEVVLKARDSNFLAPYIPMQSAEAMVTFSQFSYVEHLAKKLEIVVCNKEFLNAGVRLYVQGKAESLEIFLAKVKTLQYG